MIFIECHQLSLVTLVALLNPIICRKQLTNQEMALVFSTNPWTCLHQILSL